MIANKLFVVLVSALALMPTATKLCAEPVIFFFSGQITERRAQNSVFTEPDTDQFYGYFSYDTSATRNDSGSYPLIEFSIDGNSLNSANAPYVNPLIGISIHISGWLGLGSMLEIEGLYPPAGRSPYDDGSVVIRLFDSSGSVLSNNSLPTSLSLSSFDSAYLLGPTTAVGPLPWSTQDRGTITQLIQIPEPAACGLLGLGLLATCCWRRRQTHAG